MPCVLNVEDANVISRRDNGPIVGVRHELDGEDVTPMTRHYRCSETELRCRRFGVVRVYIDAMVV
jgi:hypothetical protein